MRQVDLDKVNADDKFVPFSALRVLQEIGRGAFGSVYKVCVCLYVCMCICVCCNCFFFFYIYVVCFFLQKILIKLFCVKFKFMTKAEFNGEIVALKVSFL